MSKKELIKNNPPTAIKSLSNQLSLLNNKDQIPTPDIRQQSIIDNTITNLKEQKITLWDVAPWSNSVRCIPNDYARSALFTVRNKRHPREALQNYPIYSVNKEVSIVYTGIELRAEDDELVWQQILEYSKRLPIGDPVRFTFSDLCKDLGWSINGTYYKKADNCLSRLQATAIHFNSERTGIVESISLIDKFRVVPKNKRVRVCEVTIDHRIILLFAGNHYTKFVWIIYRKLSPIARRLFDYFASHRDPYPIKLETFKLMCGSKSTRPNKWKEQVNDACKELIKSQLIHSASIKKGLICCERD